MTAIVRSGMIVVGVMTMIGGLVLIIAAPSFVPPGLWIVVFGAVLVLVPLIEKNRYRSAAAEQSGLAPGPGGGEAIDAPIEARFQPTSERFVDPTTGVPMVVLIDPQTGERRYRSEG